MHKNFGSIAELSSIVAPSESCSYLLIFSVAATIPMYDAIPTYTLLVLSWNTKSAAAAGHGFRLKLLLLVLAIP